jgi:uncharacterized RDD family membrane protein YckC
VAAVAAVQIVVIEGPNTGRQFDLAGSTTIGRDPTAGIVIDDAEASRRHASVSVQGEVVTVEDLGSTNGTFLNGQRTSGAQTFGTQDKLRIGTTVFELRVSAAATQLGTPPPDLDAIQVTAPRQVPDFTKPGPASEPVMPGAPGGGGGLPGGEPAGGAAAGPPPPPGGAPPSSGPPPTNAPPPAAGPPTNAPPPAAGPPPSAPPPGDPRPGFAPPPTSAPPHGFGVPAPGGAQPPPFSPGGLLAPSPYAVPPGVELSGWWRRVGATLLDLLISLPFLIFIYVLVVSPILMGRDGPNNGQTWGKQALGIRVVRDDGQPFKYGTALLRDFVIKGLLFGAIAILSLIDSLWPLWDEQNQALHDKLVGTHVLRT